MTTTTTKTRYYTSKSGRAFSGGRQQGYKAIVDEDGTVRVWDDVAGHYTTCHSLTAAQQRIVKARAK